MGKILASQGDKYREKMRQTRNKETTIRQLHIAISRELKTTSIALLYILTHFMTINYACRSSPLPIGFVYAL